MDDVEIGSAKAVLRAARVAAWVWDVNRNPSIRRELGTPNEPLADEVTCSLDRIHSQDRDRVMASAHASLKSRAPYAAEYRVISPDGRTKWMLDQGDVEIDERGELRILGISIDITERKKREEDLRRRKNDAEKAVRRKAEFLSRISHALRTPLGDMMGSAEQLMETQLATRDRRDLVQDILASGDELSRAIDEIIDISKLETQSLELERIPFPLTTILEDVVTALCGPAHEKGLLLKVLPEGRIPEVIVSDPGRLRQILFSVLDSAIRFTPRGRVELRVKDVTPSGSERRTLRFTVKDTGLGLRKEEVERLFEPFAVLERSVTRKCGGAGLGLALSRKLAKAMGGSLVLAESGVGAGSTFVITIDAGPKREALALLTGSVETPEDADATGSLRDLRVLLIEEVEDNRHIVHRFLGPTGAAVDFVEDGEEGVEKALAESFDVILMNTQMHNLDGFSAIRMLRSRDYSKPVIALTTNTMAGEREKCLSAGFDERILKPIERGALVEAVRRVAGGSLRAQMAK